jgi:hypothetical protein
MQMQGIFRIQAGNNAMNANATHFTNFFFASSVAAPNALNAIGCAKTNFSTSI